MKTARSIPAGIVDAGCASLATFGVGLLATRTLSAAGLGAYALFFSALLVAAIVPAHLLFYPAEIRTLPEAGAQRLRVWRQTVRLGAGPAVVAALVAAGAAALAAQAVPRDVVVGLGVTVVVAASVSPLQDHLRRLLHIGDRAWAAATVSVVQLAGVLAATGAGLAVGVAPSWIPFGALAVANIVSLMTGVVLAERAAGHASAATVLAVGDLLDSGRWLLVLGLAPPAAMFLGSVVITRIAGPEVLGYAEAARIVGQPLYVLAAGLQGALGPRLLEAGAERDRAKSRGAGRPFSAVLVVGGIGYAAVAGGAWMLNPMVHLVPAAYAVPGLVAVYVVANTAYGLAFPYRLELMGGRREQTIAGVEVIGGALQVGVAVLAGLIGAFARPLGLLVQSLAHWAGLARIRQRHYRQGVPAAPASPAPGGTGPSAE